MTDPVSASDAIGGLRILSRWSKEHYPDVDTYYADRVHEPQRYCCVSQEESKVITYPIVGAHFRPPAKAILGILPAGAALIARPEPDNQFDPNAIQIIVGTDTIPPELHVELGLRCEGYGFTIEDVLKQSEWHLGYIPAKDAKFIKLPDDKEGKLTFDPTGKAMIELDLEAS